MLFVGLNLEIHFIITVLVVTGTRYYESLNEILGELLNEPEEFVSSQNLFIVPMC